MCNFSNLLIYRLEYVIVSVYGTIMSVAEKLNAFFDIIPLFKRSIGKENELWK